MHVFLPNRQHGSLIFRHSRRSGTRFILFFYAPNSMWGNIYFTHLFAGFFRVGRLNCNDCLFICRTEQHRVAPSRSKIKVFESPINGFDLGDHDMIHLDYIHVYIPTPLMPTPPGPFPYPAKSFTLLILSSLPLLPPTSSLLEPSLGSLASSAF